MAGRRAVPHKVTPSKGPDCGGPRRTCRDSLTMSAYRGKADVPPQGGDSVYDPKRTLPPKDINSTGFGALSSIEVGQLHCTHIRGWGALMRRREFIGLIGTTALSFARPGYAQTKTDLPRVSTCPSVTVLDV